LQLESGLTGGADADLSAIEAGNGYHVCMKTPRTIRLGSLFFVLVLTPPAATATPKKKPWDDSYYEIFKTGPFMAYKPAHQPIDFDHVDPDLLGAALFYETNRRRIQHRKKPLLYSPALRRAALDHAREMVTHDFHGHVNPDDPEKRTLDLRLKRVGIRGGAMSENVAYVPGRKYPIMSRRPGQGIVRITPSKPAKPHTYKSFAEAVLDGLMYSPGHKRNILSDRTRYLGCAAVACKKEVLLRHGEVHKADYFKVAQAFAAKRGPDDAARQDPGRGCWYCGVIRAGSPAGGRAGRGFASRDLAPCPLSARRYDGGVSDADERRRAAEAYRRIRAEYECHNHRHAVAILVQDFPDLFVEICDALLRFRFTTEQVKQPGGSESRITKAFAAMLRGIGWHERNLRAKLVVDEEEVTSETHKIDFVKGGVALDCEWNSKDQTFDRDRYAFRAFFEYRKIAVGLLVTRSDELDAYVRSLGEYVDKYGVRRRYAQKYGASTTHMAKLRPRLHAGRSGGCPVLAIGITRKQLREHDG
jgi:uncharacterized protein YkwD